jgi:tetratricopeptide (TPR) repeat protein
MKRRVQTLSMRLCAISGMILFFVQSNIAQDLNSAIKLSLSERYEDANAAYEKIIKNEPANGDAYFYYGENILQSYIADPFSATLTDVSKTAKDIFQRGLQADSTNKLNAIGIGMVILLEKNDTTAADVYFNKAVQEFPKNKKKYTEKHILMLSKLGTAQLYAKSPRYKKAIAYLELAKEIAPTNPLVADALGDVHMGRNDASSAIQNYNRALYLNPSSPIYNVKIGNIYMYARNLAEAKNYFEKAKEIDSTFAPLYKGLGSMYYMSGKYKTSKENYKKFLDLSGNNISAMVSYANALFKSKDYDEAINVINEILEKDKSRPYLYRLAGYSAFDKKPADYAKSLKYMELLFKDMAPDKIIVKDYKYYGKTLVNLKQDTSQIDKGLLTLKRAYEMDTTDNELLDGMVYYAQSLKRFRVASDLFHMKVAMHKAAPADYMGIGKLFYQNKLLGKADTIFSMLIQKDPNNVQAYLWLANTYYSMDPEFKLGIARPKYEMVVEKAESDTSKYMQELYTAYSYLGSYYLFNLKPEPRKAIPYFLKITKLNPKNNEWLVKAYQLLGIAYSNKTIKEYEEAKKYYKMALALDPNNKDIKKAIEDIDKVLKSRQQ